MILWCTMMSPRKTPRKWIEHWSADFVYVSLRLQRDGLHAHTNGHTFLCSVSGLSGRCGQMLDPGGVLINKSGKHLRNTRCMEQKTNHQANTSVYTKQKHCKDFIMLRIKAIFSSVRLLGAGFERFRLEGHLVLVPALSTYQTLSP